MSETRRELFKTSVIGAVGLSVGALAGFAVSESILSPQVAITPLAGTVIAVHAQDGSWYFFKFDTPSDCELRTAVTATTSPPTAINVLDTAHWLTSLSSTQIKQNTLIKYTKYDGTSDQIQINLTQNYFLDSDSLYRLLQLSGSEWRQLSGSWNEIGKF